MTARRWLPFLLLELIAVLHLLRLILGTELVIDGRPVPMLVSVVAIILFGVAGWFVWSDGASRPGAR